MNDFGPTPDATMMPLSDSMTTRSGACWFIPV